MIREMIWKRREMKAKCDKLLVQYKQVVGALGEVFPQLPMLTWAVNSPFARMKRANAHTSVMCALVSLLLYGLGFPVSACGSLLSFGMGAGSLALYAAWKASKPHEIGGEKYLPANDKRSLRILVGYFELIPRLIAEMETARARHNEEIEKFKKEFEDERALIGGGKFEVLYDSRIDECRVRISLTADENRRVWEDEFDLIAGERKRFLDWAKQIRNNKKGDVEVIDRHCSVPTEETDSFKKAENDESRKRYRFAVSGGDSRFNCKIEDFGDGTSVRGGEGSHSRK